MIKNDRQYRISKARADEFRAALEELAADGFGDPLLTRAIRDSTSSQLHEIEYDINDYERLRTGTVGVIRSASLADLPTALIRARIARGFTQAQLAEKLGLHEQQIQRWEVNDYVNVSLQTLARISEALGVEARGEIFVPHPKLGRDSFLRVLAGIGITKEMLRKLVPPEVAEPLLEGTDTDLVFASAFKAANLLERFVGIPADKLLALESLQPAVTAAAIARFKIPANAKTATVQAQAVIANYLAALVVSSWRDSDTEFPAAADDIRRALAMDRETVSLAKLVAYAWDCGVAIVPLRVTGGFHGAVWRIEGRCVVVLKQVTALEARWIFDLLHELGHVARGHVQAEDTVIESQPIAENSSSQIETEANEWAQGVLFGSDDRLEKIEAACEQATRGSLERLKNVVPKIAEEYHLPVGILANHLAHRLGEQGSDWWGAAQNLQAQGVNPFEIVRSELLHRIDLHRLNPVDRDLMVRSLMED
jgi:transcriptional regulator with XRE-family HTH domain/Zn-dependent peptidase ImmA (M78 family)